MTIEEMLQTIPITIEIDNHEYHLILFFGEEFKLVYQDWQCQELFCAVSNDLNDCIDRMVNLYIEMQKI